MPVSFNKSINIGFMQKRVLLSMLFTMLCISSIAAPPTRLNLSKAIQQHIVTVKAEATGNSYLKQGLKLTIKNTGSLTYLLVMDNGVVFTPDSAGFQPLLLAGEETLMMQPLKEGTVNVQTFCANSDARAPIKGLSYNYGYKSGDTLVRLIDFLHKNRMYSDLGQSAVWMFTNGHSFSTVYDASNEFVSKKLQGYIITLTGRQLPEYYVQSSTSSESGQPVYNPRVLKIYASFEEKLSEPKKLTLAVYNAAGEVIQPVFENRNYGAAGHRFKVEFEAKGVDPGEYFIRLSEGETILKETVVEVK